MDDQVAIKILLISVFCFFCYILLAPMRGARNQAIRRLVLIVGLAFIILAVVFPSWINAIANLVGVGRGTDLVLYIVAIFVIGNSISSSRKNKQMQVEITVLARALALEEAS
jgi:hypothetical protein